MRVKKGLTAQRRHKKVRQLTKSMSRANRSSSRRGKQALTRALTNAYRDRRNLKRTNRALWNIRINAAARENGLTYSGLISNLKKAGIKLDRKVLSEIAVHEPKAFSEIVSAVKK